MKISYEVSSTVKDVTQCVLPPEDYKGGPYEWGPNIGRIEQLLVKAVGQPEPQLKEIAEEIARTCFVDEVYQGHADTFQVDKVHLIEILRRVARDGYTPAFVPEAPKAD